eukprot:333234_1
MCHATYDNTLNNNSPSQSPPPKKPKLDDTSGIPPTISDVPPPLQDTKPQSPYISIQSLTSMIHTQPNTIRPPPGQWHPLINANRNRLNLSSSLNFVVNMNI